MKIFYFTGTGNSLYVAKQIGGELYSIPQMIKENNYDFEDEAIGFVFPCYFLGLPRIVIDFINKSNFKAKYFFAVITYGGTTASGLKQMEKLLRKNDINLNYANEILMVDNYLPFFKIEDQLKKESNQYVDENIHKIVNDIKNRQEMLINKGIGLDLLSKIFNNIALPYSQDYFDKNFIINDKCVKCKICEKVCPVQNICVEEKLKFSHKCEGCLACIHHCPKNAIHLKNERSGIRFINHNVKLTEIIEANNQKKFK